MCVGAGIIWLSAGLVPVEYLGDCVVPIGELALFINLGINLFS